MRTIPTATTASWQGPCSDNPEHWDLDNGTLAQWLQAIRTCHECPFLKQCDAAMAEFWPEADRRKPANNPAGVIIAGTAYSETGRVLDRTGLSRIAAVRRSRQQRELLATQQVSAGISAAAS